tara:strand:+ start:338 stop:499 length:162 start_codon:yes stop_codon:yes gene_type:complete
MTFEPKSEPLTNQDIKEVSTNYLKSVVKNSDDNQLIIKCLKEISRRNTRRPIN